MTDKTEAPKELMDCVLSNGAVCDIMYGDHELLNPNYAWKKAILVAKAQLQSPRLQAYIADKVTKAVKAEIKQQILEWIMNHHIGFTMGNDLETNANIHHANDVSFWHISAVELNQLKEEIEDVKK